MEYLLRPLPSLSLPFYFTQFQSPHRNLFTKKFLKRVDGALLTMESKMPYSPKKTSFGRREDILKNIRMMLKDIPCPAPPKLVIVPRLPIKRL